jgi:hypothetical protein
MYVIVSSTESVRCRPEPQGAVNCGGSPGNDTDSDGALLTAPQPYKGEKTRVSPVCLRVPLECGLEPKGIDSPNPADGFHVLQGVEEVKSSSLFRDYMVCM